MTEIQPAPEARPVLNPEALKTKLLSDLNERVGTAPSPLVYQHTTTLNAGTPQERTITTDRLTIEGKREAALAYTEIAGLSDAEDLETALREVRGEIQAKVNQYRQMDSGELSREWRAARKFKTHDRAGFRKELDAKLAADSNYQHFLAEQKLLGSISQKVRAEAQKPARERIKAEITPEEVIAFRTELTQAGKKAPNEALLYNILVQKRLKAEREAAKTAEVTPPEPAEATGRPVETPTVETPDQRAEALTARVEARRASLAEEVKFRLQVLGSQARDLATQTWKQIRRKPALAISSAVALASVAYLSSSAGFVPPAAAETPQPTPVVRVLTRHEQQAISRIEMPRLATEPAPRVSLSSPSAIAEAREITHQQRIIAEERRLKPEAGTPTKPVILEPEPKEPHLRASQPLKTEELARIQRPSETPQPTLITPETQAKLTQAKEAAKETMQQLGPETAAKIEQTSQVLGGIVDQYETLRIGGFKVQAQFGENVPSYGKMTATRTPDGIFKYAKGYAKDMQAQIDKLSSDPRFAEKVKNIQSEADAQRVLTEMGIMVDCAGLVSNILTEALAQKGIDFYQLIDNNWGYVSPATYNQLGREAKIASFVEDKAINYRPGTVVLFYLFGEGSEPTHATIISRWETTDEGVIIHLTESSDVVQSPNKGVHDVRILITDPEKSLKDQLFLPDVQLDPVQWAADTGKPLPQGVDIGHRLRIQPTRAVQFHDL